MDGEKFRDTEHAQSFYSTARDYNWLAITKVTHVNAHSYLTGCWTETRHCSEDFLARHETQNAHPQQGTLGNTTQHGMLPQNQLE